jgi:mRNA interferase MazF
MPPIPRRGEIWLTRFDPVEGHEQGGIRPALIISSDRFNRLAHEMCMVAPLTTRFRPIPSHVRVAPPEGGLARVSYVLCDQLRTLSTLRLKTRFGDVSTETVEEVQRVLSELLLV